MCRRSPPSICSRTPSRRSHASWWHRDYSAAVAPSQAIVNFTLFKSSQPSALEPKISVPEMWSDEHGTALRGWILVPNGPPDRLELVLDGEPIPVLSWHPRPQVVARHPEFRSGENCGFCAYAPRRRSSRELRIRGTAGGQEFSRTLDLPSKLWTTRAQKAARFSAASAPS